MRRTADLLYRGSQLLAERIPAGIAGWIGEGKERNDRVLRIVLAVGLLIVLPLLIAMRPKTVSGWLAVAGLTGAILVAAQLAPIIAVILVMSFLATTAPAIMWLFLAAWITGAILAAKPKKAKGERPADTPRQATPEPQPDAVEEPEDEAPLNPLLALLDELIGNGNGVHLATVLEHLQRAGMRGPLDTAGLRSRIEALGVRVRPSLKVAGAVRAGVHREDLEAALTESPTVDPMGPAHEVATPNYPPLTSNNYPPATPVATTHYPTRQGSEKGLDDHIDDALTLANPHRHHAA